MIHMKDAKTDYRIVREQDTGGGTLPIPKLSTLRENKVIVASLGQNKE